MMMLILSFSYTWYFIFCVIFCKCNVSFNDLLTISVYPACRFLTDWNMLSSSLSLYKAMPTSFPFPPAEKKCPDIMLPFTTLDRRDGVTWVLGCIWLAPNIVLCFWAKDLNFCLFRTQSFHPKVFSLVTWLPAKPSMTHCWRFFQATFPDANLWSVIKIVDV